MLEPNQTDQSLDSRPCGPGQGAREECQRDVLRTARKNIVKFISIQIYEIFFNKIGSEKEHIHSSLCACLDRPPLLFVSFHSLDKDEKCDTNRAKEGGTGGCVEENQLVEIQARGPLHWILQQGESESRSKK